MENEPKVVGPLTLRQFMVISGGSALSFAVYFTLGKSNLKAALGVVAAIMFVACFAAFVRKGDK